jgi:hypothetical protein
LAEFPPKNHDSLVAVGRNGPSGSGQVRLSRSGLLLPAGKIEPREKYYNYDFDEIVVYDENRVSIRYVVRLSDSSKPVSDSSFGQRIVGGSRISTGWKRPIVTARREIS